MKIMFTIIILSLTMSLTACSSGGGSDSGATEVKLVDSLPYYDNLPFPEWTRVKTSSYNPNDGNFYAWTTCKDMGGFKQKCLKKKRPHSNQ